MRVRGVRGRALLCGGVLLTITTAGSACGSDDGSSTASDKPRFSAASESPRIFMTRTAKLLQTTTAKEDCAQIEAVNSRSMARFPCPAEKDLRKSMASFKVVDAQEFGTGAVVDYKSGKLAKGAAIVLLVAPDRNWGIGQFGVLTEPSTKTDDAESRDEFAASVEGYLGALRKSDCDAYAKWAYIGKEKPKAACKQAFSKDSVMAKAAKANPDVEPRYLGGNATYGFYSFETRKPKPTNMTISVVKSDDKPDSDAVVLLAGPSPTTVDQKRAERQLQRQLDKKKNSPGSMAPSSTSGKKAD